MFCTVVYRDSDLVKEKRAKMNWFEKKKIGEAKDCDMSLISHAMVILTSIE